MVLSHSRWKRATGAQRGKYYYSGGLLVCEVKDGRMYRDGPTATVYLVDLATRVCTVRQSTRLSSRVYSASARMADGRIVCVGGYGEDGDNDSSSSLKP